MHTWCSCASHTDMKQPTYCFNIRRCAFNRFNQITLSWVQMSYKHKHPPQQPRRPPLNTHTNTLYLSPTHIYTHAHAQTHTNTITHRLTHSLSQGRTHTETEMRMKCWLPSLSASQRTMLTQSDKFCRHYLCFKPPLSQPLRAKPTEPAVSTVFSSLPCLMHWKLS